MPLAAWVKAPRVHLEYPSLQVSSGSNGQHEPKWAWSAAAVLSQAKCFRAQSNPSSKALSYKLVWMPVSTDFVFIRSSIRAPGVQPRADTQSSAIQSSPLTQKEIAFFLKRSEHELSVLDNHSWASACYSTFFTNWVSGSDFPISKAARRRLLAQRPPRPPDINRWIIIW